MNLSIPAWLCNNVALLALIGLYCVAVLVADLTIWPGRTPTILLSLPILVASLKKPPQFIIIAALIAIIVDAVDIASEHPPISLSAVSFLALVAVSFMATFIALQRQQATERTRQHQATICAVEQLRQPLTVVLGYTQILLARSDLPAGVAVYLERISLAAKRLKQQIDQLLADGLERSG